MKIRGHFKLIYKRNCVHSDRTTNAPENRTGNESLLFNNISRTLVTWMIRQSSRHCRHYVSNIRRGDRRNNDQCNGLHDFPVGIGGRTFHHYEILVQPAQFRCRKADFTNGRPVCRCVCSITDQPAQLQVPCASSRSLTGFHRSIRLGENKVCDLS